MNEAMKIQSAARDALISDLKAAVAERAALMRSGKWAEMPRHERESLNGRMTDIQLQIAGLR